MRVPLTTIPLTTRDGTIAKDSHSSNVIGGQKRPGLALHIALASGAGIGQGMFMHPTLGALAVVGNSIYSITTGLLIAAIPSGIGPYNFVPALPNGVIAFKDTANIWTMLGSVVTLAVSSMAGVVVNAMITLNGFGGSHGGTAGVYALTIGGPGAGAAGTYTIGAQGNLVGITITAGGAGYTTVPVLSFPLGGLIGGEAVATISAAVPQALLPGFVNLDNTFYTLRSDRKINGSDLGNPASWPPLNMLIHGADSGVPVAITRQLNYLVAFSDSFTIFYYDASNPPPGSPLSPAQNTYMDIGCAAAGSIAELRDTVVFIATSAEKGRSILALVGMQHQTLSTPHVDAILNRSTLADAAAFGVRTAKGDLYVLALPDLLFSLVYDFNAKEWNIWTSSTTVVADPVVANNYAQTYFTSTHYLSSGGMDLLQHDTNGKIYQLSSTTFLDGGLPIDVNFVTPVLEGENSDYIRIGAAELIGDKVSSTAYIRYSDDDYATWSTYQTVPLLQSRSQTVRQGAMRRRAYQIRHTDSTALNMRTLNLDVTK